MLEHLASRAKAYAALIGSVLTAIVGTGTDNKWLTLAAAVLTAIATYQIPNADPTGEHQDESVLPPPVDGPAD